jgi:hypothetical protein
MAELPPGFVLDQPASAPTAGVATPGLPPGFILDATPAPAPAQPAKTPWKGGILPISEGPDGKPQFDSNAGIFGIAKDIAKSAVSGATLPGDVYAGKVDPMSDEGIGRSFELAQFASPLSVANKSRMVMTPPQSPIARDAAEAGVTLTTGQRTGNPSILSREDAALGGGLGGRVLAPARLTNCSALATQLAIWPGEASHSLSARRTRAGLWQMPSRPMPQPQS